MTFFAQYKLNYITKSTFDRVKLIKTQVKLQLMQKRQA